MLAGRFVPLLAVLAVAGSLAGKRVSPAGLGTLRTDTPTFGFVLVGVVLIVALLTFVPALLLGPVVQGLPTSSSDMRELTPPRRRRSSSPWSLGLAYPLAMTGFAQVAFPGRADGSMVESGGKVVGSRLIGQDFAKRPRVLPEPPVGHRLRAGARRSSTTRARTSRSWPASSRGELDAYLARERPFTPGLTRRPDPVRRGDDVGLGHRPAHLRGRRRASRPTASRAERGLPLGACSRWSTTMRAGRSSGSRRPRSVNVLELNLALDREVLDRSILASDARSRLVRASSIRAQMVRNPVMFVVEVGARLHHGAVGRRASPGEPGWFAFTVAVWLWLTVLFGNLAEAIAEGRGKAQAATLRAMRTDTVATLRDGARAAGRRAAPAATSSSSRPAS